MMLQRLFQLEARASGVAREGLAGLTSFLAAAYLIIVIPGLLASGGIDRAAATTATICLLAFGSIAMGLFTNLPFLVGPGIGGSALLGVTLAQIEHVPWPAGLGIALLSGLIFLVLTLTGARGLVVRLVPAAIKRGLGASIGLYIALLGCRDAGLVALNPRAHAYALGNFAAPGAIVALIGLAVALALQLRAIPGAMLAGILVAALAGIPLGVTTLPGAALALPHGLAPVALRADLSGALALRSLPYLFAFFAAEFFSTLGTTLAVGAEAGLTDAQGDLPAIERPFLIDSLAATLGPLIGVPAGTALIESAAGVAAGGRTGLTAVAAGGLFLLTLLLTPLAMAIPRQATAPAPILIGITMLGTIRTAAADDDGLADLVPTMAMLLTTLIANSFGSGIAAGILVYVLVQILAGKTRALPIGLVLLALPLAYYFAVAASGHS